MTHVMRVLAVDDDRDVRALLRDLLEGEGFAVETASDGDEALRALAARDFDCVLLDIMMPGTDGHAVLEQIRSSERGMDLPVVMVTALADDNVQWRVWSAGADYLLTKPFEPEVLTSYLHWLADHDRDAVQGGVADAAA